MHNPFIADNNLDEIVFANRNKAYGAYALRKDYGSNVTQSVFIVFSSMLLLFGASYLFVGKGQTEKPFIKPMIDEEVVVTEIKLDEILRGNVVATVVPPQQAPPPVNTNTTLNNNYLIAPNTEVPARPSDKMQVSDPSDNTTPGKNLSGSVGSGTSDNNNNGTPGGLEYGRGEIAVATDVMPEFAMGDLYVYLQKHLQYPAQALREGIEGKVIVRFDIMADGSITNVKLLKGIGFGCDEEAMRVIKEMPAWKPGIQAGKAVPVRLSLPIKFIRE